jgi:hypothetical protein
MRYPKGSALKKFAFIVRSANNTGNDSAKFVAGS